jgi:hypothetical protein
LTLRLTSDRSAEVHMHGYDLEKEVSPDEETDLSFGANLTGRFDIRPRDGHGFGIATLAAALDGQA